jgi:hypothetical protein
MDEELSDRPARAGAPPRAPGRVPVLGIQTPGLPVVRRAGASEDVPLCCPTGTALALLLYLAVTGAPQPWEQLAALFWPDREDDCARATFRLGAGQSTP